MAELTTDPQVTPHCVVIGSSAGGIEALSTLLATLSAKFPAPIIIAQHLDPAHPSQLVGILSRHCDLPVQLVVEQQPFAAGTVYVIPPDRQIEIVDHLAHLERSHEIGARPSVDRLFSTAATAYGDQVIAVVLSGTGFDGAAGARVVHEAGGTVVIQDPETAEFPGMPRSLAPATVDIVANVEEIGPLLQRLVTDVPTLETQSEQETFEQILEWVRIHRGVDFSQYRQPTIVRRLRRRMVATQTQDLGRYLAYLQSNPDEEQLLVSSFLIKVTDFFRDRDMFAYLRETILPKLIAQAQDQPEGLRIWSAGCATGEEAYSIAIEVLELLRERQLEIPVRIFATDLENSAVTFARRGVYPASALKTVPPELIARYFQVVDGEYEVNDDIRKLTVFGLHDLVQTPPFPRIDLLLCRNVLMYFTSELQSVALHALAFSLRAGGFLVLGSAESTRPMPECFSTDDAGLKIYCRNDHPATFRSTARSFGLQLPVRPTLERRYRTRLSLNPRPAPDLQLSSRSNADSLLLELPVGVAVVDTHYDIESINVAAREMLGIHGVAIGDDIVHLLNSFDSTVLRNVIDTAFKERVRSEVDEISGIDMTTGQARFFHITCAPLKGQPDSERPGRVVIIIRDITDEMQRRVEQEQQTAAQQDELNNVVAQIGVLSETNRRLLEANEELTIAEERWRSLKDEYAMANAEAAAANEELETYAEELQASGEELEALNEELKATVEELGVSNANLDERAKELLEQRQIQEDFVERASHELRTPLTAIRGYLQLIARRAQSDATDESLGRLVDETLEQERRLEDLVNELMDVTRIQNRQLRLNLQPIDLLPLVSRVVEVGRVMAQGQLIELTLEAESLVVNADVIRLEGVLYNLLSNAIKYAPDTPKIEVGLRRVGDEAEITVRDYGPGIPAAELPQIFSRFYQSEHAGPAIRSGLGLGLYIGREVVAAHGGTIDAASTEGEGATFTIRLPLRHVVEMGH